MNKEIQIVKLVNGDTYIGKVGLVGEVYHLQNAVAIELQPNSTGNGVSVGFAPVSYFVEAGDKGNNISIDKMQVLFVDKPSKQIYDAYNQQFGSGLIGTTGPGLITE